MPRRSSVKPPATPVKPFDPKTFKISGTTYKLIMHDFRVQPTGKNKVGSIGMAYTYTISTREDMDDFIKHFDDGVSDYADKNGCESTTYDQFVRDAGKF